jgi:hypothetical protein
MREVGQKSGDARELPEDFQRWTAKGRAAFVMTILKGETSVADAPPRRHLS